MRSLDILFTPIECQIQRLQDTLEKVAPFYLVFP